jgi:hypothetical protein
LGRQPLIFAKGNIGILIGVIFILRAVNFQQDKISRGYDLCIEHVGLWATEKLKHQKVTVGLPFIVS